jgi:hypothetical protein
MRRLNREARSGPVASPIAIPHVEEAPIPTQLNALIDPLASSMKVKVEPKILLINLSDIPVRGRKSGEAALARAN